MVSVINMRAIDIIILDAVLIFLPLTSYLLYLAFTKTFNKKENNLLIIVAIFSIFYLIFKYSFPAFPGLPFIIINIPLLISYIKKDELAIIASSILLIFYYYSFYDNFLILIVLEYILYYLLYLKKLKNSNMYTFIFTFSLIKTIITAILLIYTYHQFETYIINTIISCTFLCIFAIIILYFITKAESLLKLHMNIKEIKHNEQIHTSLFQITHEIKNPIAVCKGYLDMFDKENPEHFKKYLPILKEEINRTLLLVEDFLAMNKAKINKDISDINLLIEEVSENIEMLCQKNNITLTVNTIDDDIYLKADYNRLTQVFINLLKNSIEAIPKEKQGKIKIEEKLEKNNIIITIIDNGKGMNEVLLNKIKEPFYTTKQKGTGLGVPLSNEIIKAHSGTLTYESKEGKYTKVKIILPKEI